MSTVFIKIILTFNVLQEHYQLSLKGATNIPKCKEKEQVVLLAVAVSITEVWPVALNSCIISKVQSSFDRKAHWKKEVHSVATCKDIMNEKRAFGADELQTLKVQCYCTSRCYGIFAYTCRHVCKGQSANQADFSQQDISYCQVASCSFFFITLKLCCPVSDQLNEVPLFSMSEKIGTLDDTSFTGTSS